MMTKFRTYKYTKNQRVYYTCIAEMGYKDDGSRLRLQTHGKSKADAESAMKLKLANYAGRKVTTVDRKTLLNDYITDFWHGSRGEKLKETTRDLYITLFKSHIRPYFDSYLLRAITTERLQAFITHLNKEKGLSPATVRQIWNVLRLPLTKAFNKGLLEYDITGDIDLPALVQKKVDALSTEELVNLLHTLDVAKFSYYKFAILLLLNTGLRRGELLALQWVDINFDACTIEVKANLVRTNTGVKSLSPKTKASVRLVSFPSELGTILKERRGKYPTDKYLVRQKHQDKPVSPTNFSRYFRNVCAAAGIKEQGLHRLRHTFTSLSYAAGIDSRITQGQLGHSSLRMTLGIYTHVHSDALHTASEQYYKQLLALTTPKEEKE